MELPFKRILVVLVCFFTFLPDPSFAGIKEMLETYSEISQDAKNLEFLYLSFNDLQRRRWKDNNLLKVGDFNKNEEAAVQLALATQEIIDFENRIFGVIQTSTSISSELHNEELKPQVKKIIDSIGAEQWTAHPVSDASFWKEQLQSVTQITQEATKNFKALWEQEAAKLEQHHSRLLNWIDFTLEFEPEVFTEELRSEFRLISIEIDTKKIELAKLKKEYEETQQALNQLKLKINQKKQAYNTVFERVYLEKIEARRTKPNQRDHCIILDNSLVPIENRQRFNTELFRLFQELLKQIRGSESQNDRIFVHAHAKVVGYQSNFLLADEVWVEFEIAGKITTQKLRMNSSGLFIEGDTSYLEEALRDHLGIRKQIEVDTNEIFNRAHERAIDELRNEYFPL